MGCAWKTVRGRRTRVGPVGSPVSALAVSMLSVAEILDLLALPSVHASPEVTAVELEHAIVRVWRHPESGYYLESRWAPGAEMMLRPISQDEATLWTVKRPTSAMIARAFHPPEPVEY